MASPRRLNYRCVQHLELAKTFSKNRFLGQHMNFMALQLYVTDLIHEGEVLSSQTKL